MLVKLLNKIGLYTKEQFVAEVIKKEKLAHNNALLQVKNRRLSEALKASEEAKANALTELKKIREKYIRRIKGRKI